MAFEFDIQDGQIDLLADAPALEQETKEPIDTSSQFDLLAEDPIVATESPKESPEEDSEIAPTELEPEDIPEEAPEDEASIYQKYADNLQKMGIFSLDEDEENIKVSSTDELAARFQKESQKTAHNYIYNKVNEKGAEYGEAWEAIFEKGLNPYEYFQRSEQIDNFESLDMESEDNQKLVYREAQKRYGVAPEKIEEKLQRFIDLGALEDEAKDMQVMLVNYEKQSLQQRTAQVEQEQKAQAKFEQEYQSSIISVLNTKIKDKEIDGIPLNEKQAQSTLNYLFDTSKYTYRNQPISEMDAFILSLNDPKNIELKLKVALLAQNGFKTDKIAKKAVSKETNTLFRDLATKAVQEKRTTTSKPQSNFFD